MKFSMLMATMLMSVSASADYFKAGVGYSVGGEIEVEGPTSTATEDLDGAFLAPLILAYGFEVMGDVHGELEFAYRTTGYDNDVEGDPTAMTAGFNLVGNAPMGFATLTGGAGFTFGSYDIDTTGADSGTAFGVQLFGGLDFPINEAVTIGGEFRYMTTLTKFDVADGFEGSYNNTSLLFNVKFGM
jgi:opacity protein-like surface antigen